MYLAYLNSVVPQGTNVNEFKGNFGKLGSAVYMTLGPFIFDFGICIIMTPALLSKKSFVVKILAKEVWTIMGKLTLAAYLL